MIKVFVTMFSFILAGCPSGGQGTDAEGENAEGDNIVISVLYSAQNSFNDVTKKENKKGGGFQIPIAKYDKVLCIGDMWLVSGDDLFPVDLDEEHVKVKDSGGQFGTAEVDSNADFESVSIAIDDSCGTGYSALIGGVICDLSLDLDGIGITQDEKSVTINLKSLFNKIQLACHDASPNAGASPNF